MTLHGIDISKFQAGIDLSRVPGDFVIIGTSDGSVINPVADAQYQGAKKAGKLRAVYHFLRNDPITEARFWASITKGYQDGQTMFITDAETPTPNLPQITHQFGTEFHRLTGIKPITYTYWHLLQQYPGWQQLRNEDFALWGAWYPAAGPIYGYNPPARQSPPYWGESMAMWQYTDNGRLPGWDGPLDLNVFYGDRAAWLKYAAINGKPATPAPAKPAHAPVKPVPAPVQVRPTPAGTHTVASGETLTAIAAKYGTTVAALVSLNGIKDANYIQSGQVLRVPKPGTAAPAPVKPATPATYRVAPGDNLTSIAQRFGTTVTALVRLNGLPNPDYIQAGQVLRVR